MKSIETFLKYVETKLGERTEKLVPMEQRDQLKKTPAAVLVTLLYPCELHGNTSINILDNIYLLLEKRSMYMSKNPGDMAFPGGKSDENDGSLFATAAREAYEEVGLGIDNLQFHAYMDEYVSSSKLIVRAVIASKGVNIEKSKFREKLQDIYSPKTPETEYTAIVPLSHCLNPKYYATKQYEIPNGRTGYIRFIDIDEYLENTRIWGLTATIIRRFLDVIFPDNLLPKEPTNTLT